MTPAAANAPLRFDPSMERPEADEAETQAELIATMRTISESTFENSGHAIRSVHAKSHILLKGELEITADLPEPLAQGLFATPGRHPVVMRFSTNPGDLLDDSVSAPRGLAVKFVGVEGDRLPGSEGATTQDFVMGNAPAFAAPNPKKFLGTLKMLAKTTDTSQGVKKVVSGTMRLVESVAEAFGAKSVTAISLGGQPLTYVMGETFYSQTPFLYGLYVAKLSIAPVSPELVALAGEKVDIDGRADAHRDEANAFFERSGGEWEVRVQLLTDTETMPIEDASTPWPEDVSPYVTVGRIRVAPQTGWSAEKAKAVDDGLSFSPWHGLAAHRPLGGVNRVRRANYESSTSFRAEHNGCPIHEPASLERVA